MPLWARMPQLVLYLTHDAVRSLVPIPSDNALINECILPLALFVLKLQYCDGIMGSCQFVIMVSGSNGPVLTLCPRLP